MYYAFQNTFLDLKTKLNTKPTEKKNYKYLPFQR